LKTDTTIEERPDHSHYAACLGKKTEIEHRNSVILGYTLVSGLILIIFSCTGIEMPVFSWLPSLFGSQAELLPIFIQCVEIVGMSLLAALGFGKNKSFDAVLLMIYIIITGASLFTGTIPGCVITFFAGLLGVIFCRHALKDSSDYETLKHTEGYPHFSIHYTEYMEHPTYSSRYTKDAYEKSRGAYPAPPDRERPSFSASETSHAASDSYSKRSTVYMDDTDDLPTVLPNEMYDDNGDFFIPEGGSDDVSSLY